MIKTVKHKGLKDLLSKGQSARVRQDLVPRCIRRLDAINAATRPEQLNIPGFDFHAPRGKPQRYSVHVNGPWGITFSWDGEDATNVDLEQYH